MNIIFRRSTEPNGYIYNFSGQDIYFNFSIVEDEVVITYFIPEGTNISTNKTVLEIFDSSEWGSPQGEGSRYTYVAFDGWELTNPEALLNMGAVFEYYGNRNDELIIDFSNCDIPNITSLNSILDNTSKINIIGLDAIDTSNITSFGLFHDCILRNLNISNWIINNNSSILGSGNRIDNLTARNWIIRCDSISEFWNSYNEINNLDVSGWNINNVTSLYNIMGDSDIHNIIGLDTWDTGNVTNFNEIITCSFDNMDTINLSNWDLSNATEYKEIFRSCGYYPRNYILQNWVLPSSFIDSNSIFRNEYQPSNIEGKIYDVSNWDLSNISSFKKWFYEAEEGSPRLIGIDTWDISSIVSFESMFEEYAMYSYTYDYHIIDQLQYWDVSNVENFNRMFYLENTSIPYRLDFRPLNAWRDNINPNASFEKMFYGFPISGSSSEITLPEWNGYFDMDGTFHPNQSRIYNDIRFKGYRSYDTLTWEESAENGDAYYIVDDSTVLIYDSTGEWHSLN